MCGRQHQVSVSSTHPGSNLHPCGSLQLTPSSLRSLELSPFNVKSLLRRAAAYEALERYRPAYIDYKTALQISCSITAAHDGANR